MGDSRTASVDLYWGMISASLLFAFLTGCHSKSVDNTAPTGLDPLEDNTASYPTGTSDDPYPETLNLVSGSADDYDWTHGRGYIDAPIQDVWDAMADPDTVVDRRRVQDWSTTLDTDPDYAVSFETANTSTDIVTVEFDIDWIEDVVDGSADAPQTVGIRYQKVGGTDLVKLLAGSAQLVAETDDTTGVELIEHLDTVGSDSTDIENYFTDLFASVLAVSHGEALPTYE